MKTRIHKNELIDAISAQTGQTKEIAAAYLMAQFEEIEKLLVETSSAKVKGLGEFRVMKTNSESRVLFIPNFEKINKPSSYNKVEGSTTLPNNGAELNLSLPLSESNSESSPTANNYYSGVDDNITKDKATTSQDSYSSWEDFYEKKKKRNNVITVALVVVAVAVAGFIILTML